MTKNNLADKLNNFFIARPDKVVGLTQINRELHLATHPLKRLCFEILEEMADNGFLKKASSNEYMLNTHGQVLTGTFQRKSNGKNIFLPEDGANPS